MIEYIYYDYLKERQADLTHLPECYGWVDTSEGRGLVFDNIVNYDGSEVIRLHDLFKGKGVMPDSIESLIHELAAYLENNTIIYSDVSYANIICQKVDKDHFKLVIIDGLGARHAGMKFWMYRHIYPYAQYIAKRQGQKLLDKFALSLKG